jgi:hypothetical protein
VAGAENVAATGHEIVEEAFSGLAHLSSRAEGKDALLVQPTPEGNVPVDRLKAEVRLKVAIRSRGDVGDDAAQVDGHAIRLLAAERAEETLARIHGFFLPCT